ncbi:MAG: 3-deoxy-8-phosphooctulonate synthase [Rickettsiales bacterium]|nr:3-deoxy-8-phosphooctulonate synthase [Rickettsiales bacterium]
MTKHISISNFSMGNDLPFVLIAGPCQMESRDHAMEVASELKAITDALSIPLIYKTSFDKANRTSISGKRGLGLDASLPVFAEIKETFGCPTLTDIHEREQCAKVAEVVDILQIPAFLCRQTDLLIAAAESGAIINVKKGQFLAPHDMQNVAQKIADSGNDKIILTDRGVSFGYNTLITDMRSFPTMAQTGYPVVLDATHSTQQPGGMGKSSGGDRTMAPVLARAALAVGVAGVFMETHPDPDNAPSDGPCMIRLDDMKQILTEMKQIDDVRKAQINAA